MMDIVLQGPVWPQTEKIAKQYAEYPFIKNVIISTWEGEKIINDTAKIKVIYSPTLANPGKHNRNRQIVSSQVGIKNSISDICIKTRTDQEYTKNDFNNMLNYFNKHKSIDLKYLDNTGPKGAIFTIGLYKKFVFHPQDHLFFGYLEDIKKLFLECPLDTTVPANLQNPTDNSGAFSDFSKKDTRPNTYIAMFYYAKFDEKIKSMVQNPEKYIVDDAPNITESRELDAKYKNIIFKVFPKLEMFWHKHGVPYPYDWGLPYTEFCGDTW